MMVQTTRSPTSPQPYNRHPNLQPSGLWGLDQQKSQTLLQRQETPPISTIYPTPSTSRPLSPILPTGPRRHSHPVYEFHKVHKHDVSGGVEGRSRVGCDTSGAVCVPGERGVWV